MSSRTSESLRSEADLLIPGGVNSPVRAWKAVGGATRFVRSGSGSHITDVEGRTYLDFVGSWGPLIHGHAHPQVLAAVSDALARGTSFGAPTEGEIELAKAIITSTATTTAAIMIETCRTIPTAVITESSEKTTSRAMICARTEA